MKTKEKPLLQHPELPYAGTSGHSGSETSRARAVRDDSTGATGKRQRLALSIIESNYEYGVTWKELATLMNLHHGSASGVLSVLHKTGHIARLTDTRHGCKVYVAMSSINGRATERHGKNKQCPHCGGNL
jgi:DNA-binding MarR family transcriptional regulator